MGPWSSIHNINETFTEIKELNSFEQNQIFLGTQAFGSPTDMASSGVWENILLSKTPSFDGVCGILSFIIILNISQLFLLFVLTGGKSTFIFYL